MDPRKFAVQETTTIQLFDAADDPMVDENGTRAEIEIYGPGTPQYAKAIAQRNNRTMERLRKKGSADMTPEKQAAESAEFLAICTKSMTAIDFDGLTGEALYRAVYADKSIGFIADQVNAELGDWKNFTKTALKP